MLAAGRRAGERPRPAGGRRQQRRQRVDASLVVEEAGLVLLPAAQRLRWAWQPVESRLGGGWLLLRVHWREELAHRA